MLSVKKLNELNFSRALMALLLLDSVGRLIPAGTGKITSDYENIAFERDQEIIDKNQSENIEN